MTGDVFARSTLGERCVLGVRRAWSGYKEVEATVKDTEVTLVRLVISKIIAARPKMSARAAGRANVHHLHAVAVGAAVQQRGSPAS